METARSHLNHERGTPGAVIAARSTAMRGVPEAHASPADPGAMAPLVADQGKLNGALNRFLVVAEAYPASKANPILVQLAEGPAGTVGKVAHARKACNDAAMASTSRTSRACARRSGARY